MALRASWLKATMLFFFFFVKGLNIMAIDVDTTCEYEFSTSGRNIPYLSWEKLHVKIIFISHEKLFLFLNQILIISSQNQFMRQTL